ncbi:MAG: hypothetical protein AAF791_13690 [Bacteroidota bacterium]
MAHATSDPHHDEPTLAPQEALRPEADEPNGPVPGLLATAAADVQEELGFGGAEEDLGVEEEGIASGQIAGITVAILVSVFLVSFVVFWAFYLPELSDTQVEMAGEVELAPEERTILAEGMAALDNYSLTADSTFTLPIDVAMANVVEAYASPAEGDGGETASGMAPTASSREGFNIQPVQIAPADAIEPSASAASVASDPLTEAEAPESAPTLPADE